MSSLRIADSQGSWGCCRFQVQPPNHILGEERANWTVRGTGVGEASEAHSERKQRSPAGGWQRHTLCSCLSSRLPLVPSKYSMTVMMFVMMLSFYYFSRHVSATPSAVKGLPESYPRTRKPRHLQKAAPSPNMAHGMHQLCPGFFLCLPPGWVVLPRQGSRLTHPGIGGGGGH